MPTSTTPSTLASAGGSEALVRPQRLLLVDGHGVTLPDPGLQPLSVFFSAHGFAGPVDQLLYDRLTAVHLAGRSLMPFPPGGFRALEERVQRRALREWCARTGVSAPRLDAESGRAYDALQLYLHGDEHRRGYYDSVVARPGAVELSQHALDLGYTLAMLSNSERIRRQARAAGLEKYYSHFLGPEHTAHHKPHRMAYLHACSTAGFAPEETTMLDDLWFSGAELGAFVLLGPQRQTSPTPLPANVHQVDGLVQAAAVLTLLARGEAPQPPPHPLAAPRQRARPVAAPGTAWGAGYGFRSWQAKGKAPPPVGRLPTEATDASSSVRRAP